MTRDCTPPIGILAASVKLPPANANRPTQRAAAALGGVIPYSERDPARCFRGACCVLLPVDGGWYNRGKRYCRRCAALINDFHMAGEKALCVPPGSPEIPE